MAAFTVNMEVRSKYLIIIWKTSSFVKTIFILFVSEVRERSLIFALRPLIVCTIMHPCFTIHEKLDGYA